MALLLGQLPRAGRERRWLWPAQPLYRLNGAPVVARIRPARRPTGSRARAPAVRLVRCPRKTFNHRRRTDDNEAVGRGWGSGRARAQVALDPSRGGTMPKTLLLADDSVTIQKVVGISFANEDVVLLTVDNGEDAIARAREARPDLVLADILMPGKDGYEVCEAIKSDPELRHVPVLLLSGTFESYDEEHAQRVGADGHITKPFEAQALVDQVNELLARSAAPPAPSDPVGDATIVVDPAEQTGSREAYDFFDEEMAQTAPSAPRPVHAEPAAASAPTVVIAEDDEFGLGSDALELESAVEEDLRPAVSAARSHDSGRAAVDPRATV